MKIDIQNRDKIAEIHLFVKGNTVRKISFF